MVVKNKQAKSKAKKPSSAENSEAVRAEIERLKKENAYLKTVRISNVSMKVSEKGAISIYGLGRFPITLYADQWNKVLDMSGEIKTFIVDNEAQLSFKEARQTAEAEVL